MVEAPAEVEGESAVEVTFHPQQWESEGGDEMATRATDRDPVTFEVPREDATDENGDLLDEMTYESDSLKDHENAPEWVRSWEGPFFVTME